MSCGARLESANRQITTLHGDDRRTSVTSTETLGTPSEAPLGLASLAHMADTSPSSSSLQNQTHASQMHTTHRAMPAHAAPARARTLANHRAPRRNLSRRKILALVVAFSLVGALSVGSGGYWFTHRNDAVVAECQKASEQLLDSNDALTVAMSKAEGVSTTDVAEVSGTTEFSSWQGLQENAPVTAKVPQCVATAPRAQLQASVLSARKNATRLSSYAKDLTQATLTLRSAISTQRVLAQNQTLNVALADGE
jgi:hypothetical protein